MTKLASMMKSAAVAYQGIVADTTEFRRIRALPQKPPPDVTPEALSRFLGSTTMVLWPNQAGVLTQLYEYGNCIASVPVGKGKTLITYLAPKMMDSSNPVLIVPKRLHTKTKRDFAALARDWGHQDITLISYSKISRNPEYLFDLDPDLVLVDECHRFKNTMAACTQRFLAWRKAHPFVPVLMLSGTLTSRSLRDFNHIMLAVLGAENTPLPKTDIETAVWARAIDEKVEVRAHPGVLKHFTSDPTTADLTIIREGVRERIFSAPGTFLDPGTGVDASITIELKRQKLPPHVIAIMQDIHNNKVDPNGDECTPADIWRHTRTLALGFHYKWTQEPPQEWMAARRMWKRFVRETIELEMPGIDSESQVAEAVLRGELGNTQHQRWEAIRHIFKPVTVAEWHTDDILQLVIQAAGKQDVWIWSEYEAASVRLAKLTGWPFYHHHGFTKNKKFYVEDHKHGPAILSLKANMEGVNLQHYSRCIFLNPSPQGEVMEQALGRIHRSGQAEDEVNALIFCAHQMDDWHQSVRDAEYQSAMGGFKKKLILADIIE
jgi:hypothetical protein